MSDRRSSFWKSYRPVRGQQGPRGRDRGQLVMALAHHEAIANDGRFRESARARSRAEIQRIERLLSGGRHV